MLDGVKLDPDSFLARQLYSTAVTTKGKIVIGGIVTTITRFLDIEPNPRDRVFEFERFDQAAFEIMNSCKVEAGRLCQIYPGNRLLPLPNVDRTTLLHWANLYWVPCDAKVVRPGPDPPPPHSSQAGSSSSSQPLPPDYSYI